MANEITMTLSLKFSKGNVSPGPEWAPSSQNIDVTGSNYIRQVQNIGTSAEALELGAITTPGLMMVKNLDASNFVEIGYDSTGFKPTVKVKAGEFAIFRHTQTAPQAKADTSAVDIEYYLIED